MHTSHGVFTPDDITFSVRSMLDPHAHSLPGSLGALKPIEKQLVTVRACLDNDEALPEKLHRTIRACLQAQAPGLRGAMLSALQLDLDVRIKALGDKQSQAKSGGPGGADGARKGPDPVLNAMGDEGLARALWEYYKACAVKRPVYGQRAHMPYDADSYLGQLYASLKELLEPKVVQASKHMHSPKALRDFVVGWCFFWQRCLPPFQALGERRDWTSDQWEELPMHEIEDEAGNRPLPVASSVRGDCAAPFDAGGSEDEGVAGSSRMEDEDEIEARGGESFCERTVLMAMLHSDD